ncbi:MAG: tetratricopeptide repeat-containing sensor histidine kinase [Lentimicrobium sp.]|jgi:signal transduction histidine kinase/Tfp pilus assembly protein PilF|nr:tetratricopeptide repeat-containing sensor histidine kinase [Lentimicrobium sp.]
MNFNKLVCKILLLVTFVLLFGGFSAGARPDDNEIDQKLKQAEVIVNESPDEVIVNISALLKQLNSDDKPRRALAMKLLGKAHYFLNNHRQALEYYQQSYTLYMDLDDKSAAGGLLNNIGLIRQSQGDFSTALKNYQDGAGLLAQSNNEYHLSLAYTNIGNVFYVLGRYDKAIEYLSMALRIAEKLNDSTGLARGYNNIGNVYLGLKDYTIAEEYYLRALAINKSGGRDNSLATSYNNLGLVNSSIKNYEMALEYNKLALEISRRINNHLGIIHSLVNSGNIKLEEGHIDQARIFFKEALRVVMVNKDAYAYATVLIGMGSLELQASAPDASIANFNEAMLWADKTGSLTLKNLGYEGLAEAWELKGEFERALHFLKLNKSLTDSTYTSEYADKLSRLKVSFESEQTERDNQLLRQQNIYSQLALKRQQTIRNLLIIISIIIVVFSAFIFWLYQSKKIKNVLLAERNDQVFQQKEELTLLYKEQYKLNETKNKFFSIVAHDLKSPFQSILGFSELLSSEYEQLTESQRIDAANNILKVSIDTFRLIENLLEWGRSQTGTTKAAKQVFNVKEMVMNTLPVFEPMMKTKEISLTYELPTLLHAWADVDMIMTVLRNLLSNAVKFTPPGGNIHLSAVLTNDQVRLSVLNSGNGISPEVEKRLFSLDPKVQRAGTRGERGTGLGLALCREFMELNSGSIVASTVVGESSTFTIVMQPRHLAFDE